MKHITTTINIIVKAVAKNIATKHGRVVGEKLGV